MSGISRKRLVVTSSAVATTVALVLLLGTTASAGSPILHRVQAGGPDACVGLGLRPGCDASFSLLAIQRADGTVSGQLTDRFGRGLGGYQATIDCLSVRGEDAWVSGWITHGTWGDVDLTGWPVVVRVRDNGISAKDPPDQISLSALEPTCEQQPDLDLYDFPQGQVLVE